jgi:mannose-6-phosphate isomerase-like protein (cupin superfamily)
MSKERAVEHRPYWKSVDFAAIEAAGEDTPSDHRLADVSSGSKQSRYSYKIKKAGTMNPPDGSFHAHQWEQSFYVLSGTMMFQIEGEEPCKLMPGDFVVTPPGVPHRNWNTEGTEDCIHLSINTPQLVVDSKEGRV